VATLFRKHERFPRLREGAALDVSRSPLQILIVNDPRTAASDCSFCRILAGELPASFVYRDDRCAAFMDIQPVNPGHILVVPVNHASYLADIDGSSAAELMRVGHAAAAALRVSGVRCEGVNFFLADGKAAMQEIFHVHLHVIPRFRGDGFGLKFSPSYYTQRSDRSELDTIADRLSPLVTLGVRTPDSLRKVWKLRGS
jgi:histidine triad (HIT) family protein